MDRRKFLGALASIGLASLTAYFYYNEFIRPQESGVETPSFEVLADGLIVPWSIADAGDGDYLVTERIGRLSLLSRGRVSVIHEFDVYSGGEAGLLGLALDPDYEVNRRIYLYMSYSSGGDIFNRVVRYRFDPKSRSLDEGVTIIDGIPGSNIHNGGRIRFGPDGLLYITTGDASRPEYAQDLDSLGGKILRVYGDGSIPADNPFGNAVYSYGHRNPQGIDWHPVEGELFASEHGPVGHDEINHIIKGGNYGWPRVVGKAGVEGFIDPIYETGESTIAPSGSSFISNRLFDGDGIWFAVACLRGEVLALFRLGIKYDVVDVKFVFRNRFGRLRDVVVDRDGAILLLTSNRDGRGVPREGDDKVIRIRQGY